MSIPPASTFPYYPVGYTGGYTWDQVSPELAQLESGNRNVLNSASTASGYWQITNPTWTDFAPSVGVDLSQYPTAMSAPLGVQSQVAQAIFNARGIEPWKTGPQVLAALDSGASSVASAATNAAGTVASTLGAPSASASGQQSSGWLAAIFDTIASMFGRASFMIMGGVLVVLAILAAIFERSGKSPKDIVTAALS